VHGIGDEASRKQKVKEILDVVGLPQRVMNTYPSQMSGGQRQRVAIARALIMKPEVVICDEPTSALDVSVQSQILNLLGELREEFGLTYLFISHDLAVVEHLATRVAVMYLGEIVEQNSVAGLFDAPRHPYTKALLKSVLTPEPGLGVPDTQLGMAYPNPIAPPPGCHFHPRCPRATDLCKQKAPRHTPIPQGHVACHLHDPETPMYEQE
jgi:peptide/nickel transport system ATP-binding protein